MLMKQKGSNREKLDAAKKAFEAAGADLKGVEETATLLNYLDEVKINNIEIQFDLSLARGISYYTGTIFEVVDRNIQIGSISGGGRYDDLTGVFGLEGMSGVGISFGMERIYDVLEETKWPENFDRQGTRVVFLSFDESGVSRSLECLALLREKGIAAEIYPDAETKMAKKMKYADRKGIPFVAILGEEELAEGTITLKELATGNQEKLKLEALAARLAAE